MSSLQRACTHLGDSYIFSLSAAQWYLILFQQSQTLTYFSDHISYYQQYHDNLLNNRIICTLCHIFCLQDVVIIFFLFLKAALVANSCTQLSNCCEAATLTFKKIWLLNLLCQQLYRDNIHKTPETKKCGTVRIHAPTS